MSGYNGWANYETWNVSLWIQNDENLYNFARQFNSYTDYQDCMAEFYPDGETPDGVSYCHPELDLDALNEMFADL